MMSFLKKITFIVLTLIAAIGVLPVVDVGAHVLKTDGSIGAILHVNPEDDPIVGESSTLYLEFKDTNEKLNLGNCDCKLKIILNGEEISSQSFVRASETNSLLTEHLNFTFPEKGIYKIIVEGSSLQENSFSSFKLEWDLRVARESQNTNSGNQENNNFGYIAGIVIMVLISGLLIFFNKEKSKETSEKKL